MVLYISTIDLSDGYQWTTQTSECLWTLTLKNNTIIPNNLELLASHSPLRHIVYITQGKHSREVSSIHIINNILP